MWQFNRYEVRQNVHISIHNISMALGGLVVGMDRDSEHKEGTYDTSDGLHQDK